MKRKKSFVAYAIVSASTSRDVSEKVRSVVSQHGKFIKNGVVITPHGVDNVTFCEINDENSPIVDELSVLAEMHGLYPMYIIQEDKTLSAKRVKWYQVSEVKMRFGNMAVPEFLELIDKSKNALKEIYREDSVFLKLFMYHDDEGYPYVMAYNTERNPKYLGDNIGVDDWENSIYKYVEKMKPRVHTLKKVHYANL